MLTTIIPEMAPIPTDRLRLEHRPVTMFTLKWLNNPNVGAFGRICRLEMGELSCVGRYLSNVLRAIAGMVLRDAGRPSQR